MKTEYHKYKDTPTLLTSVPMGSNVAPGGDGWGVNLIGANVY